jgi:hypothetical protein
VTEGWPEGVYAAKDEPVWAVRIPDAMVHVESSRYIVISKATGRVLADQRAGETNPDKALMANGRPDFETTERPALEAFFAPIRNALEDYALRRNLRLEKYHNSGNGWDFSFRHPSRGTALMLERNGVVGIVRPPERYACTASRPTVSACG